MVKQEQRFEYRITRLLEKAGFKVINCARSKPFDLIAFGQRTVYLIELKAKDGQSPNAQQKMQSEFVKGLPANVINILIRQSKTRGHIDVFGDYNEWELETKLKKVIGEKLA